MHLVGFTVEIHYDARRYEHQGRSELERSSCVYFVQQYKHNFVDVRTDLYTVCTAMIFIRINVFKFWPSVKCRGGCLVASPPVDME